MNSPTSGHARTRHSQKPPPRALVLWTILAVTMVASGVGLGWWISLRPQSQAVPMRVQVTLDNRCGIVDDAFMVVSEHDGARATFSAGVAFIETRAGSRVYLTVSDKYPGFEFESPRKSVQAEMVLTADCGQGERIERTLDAMREQFGRSER